MSERSMLLRCLAPLLAAALVACSAASPQPDGASAMEGIARLENEGPDEVGILPSGTTQLAVRYLDAEGTPLEGVAVEFALANPAAGSSLMPATPTTDAQGRATSLLRVGSEVPDEGFDVRVSADGAEPLFIRIKVRDVATVSLAVLVAYEGARDIASYTVTRIASTTCSDALSLGLAGDPTFSYDDAAAKQRFELGPGLHYALVAWGRDATNAKLAAGCAELDAPITSDGDEAARALTVELRDLPMKVEGAYELTLDLDVSASTARLRAEVEAAAQGALPDGSEGLAYLAALEAELRARSETDALAYLGANRAALAGELDTALDGGGQVAVAQALGAGLESAGSRLELRTTYGITADVPMTLDVSMVRARNADGTSNYDLIGTLGVVPTGSIDAAYSDTFGALSIATLSVQLGLGAYGKALLSALDALPSLGTPPGCSALDDVLAAHAELAACDAGCREATCERAFATTKAAIASAVSQLDALHPNIGLRGRLPVHDRDEDGLVDDLGPAELEGSWGKAEGETEPDPVAGKVPTPMPSKGS